jgi:hypothetical protein
MVESSPHAEDHKGSWAGHVSHGGISTKFRDNDLSLPTKASFAMVESSPCRRSIHLREDGCMPVITRPLLIAEAKFVRMMAPYG